LYEDDKLNSDTLWYDDLDTNTLKSCLTVYDSFVVPLQYKELVDSIKDNTPYVDRRGISQVLPK